MKTTKGLSVILSVVLFIGAFTANSASAYVLATKGKLRTIPLTIYASPSGGSGHINDLQKAMNTWNNAGFGTLFVYGGTMGVIAPVKGDGLSAVSFGNRGKTMPIAVTNAYVLSDGTIVEADIDVNTAYVYKYSTSSVLESGYDSQSMFTHELGHVLGLGESQDPEATMYVYMPQNETKKRSLHSDDIAGVRALGY